MTMNTFSSGVNTSFSTELNENFTEVDTKIGELIKLENFSDTTEYTATGITNTWEDLKSYALSVPQNGLIMGVNLECDLKGDSEYENKRMRILLEGSTLTSTYLDYFDSPYLNTPTGTFFTTTPTTWTFNFGDVDTYTTYKMATSCSIVAVDTETTVTIQIKNTLATQTSFMENLNLNVIYASTCTLE